MPAEVSEGKSRLLPPLPPLADHPAPPPLPPGALAEDAGRCANCLTPLTGPFCARCGQHVADYHRSVWRFVADFFDSAFCWDNKFFRTLKPLLRQPGFLTQEFMAGRRVRYVHPLRLFLFTSAICLALLQFNRNFDRPKSSSGKRQRPAVKAPAVSDDSADDEKPAKSAGSPAASIPSAGTPVGSPTPHADASPANPAGTEGMASLGQILRDTMKTTREAQKAGSSQSAEDLARRWEAFGEEMEKKAESGKFNAINEKITTNIQQKASWVALAMVPIFAWIMLFAYGRQGGYFFNHLVFSLHYHTFLLMFWTAYLWLGTVVKSVQFVPLGFLLLPLLLAPPWYLYLSLQRFYGETRFQTVAKTLAIGGVHLLAIVIGMASAGIDSSL